MLVQYNYPDDFPRDPRFQLKVNGETVPVFATNGDAFAHFQAEGPLTIEIQGDGLGEAEIKPLRHQVAVEKSAGGIRFAVAGPGDYLVDLSPSPGLFLYIDGPDTKGPSGGAHVFKAGRFYSEGEVSLQPGQSIFLEPGAVVEGRIVARKADDVHIGGRGILDGGLYAKPGNFFRSIVLSQGRGASVSDILMIRPTSWMLVIGDCDDVEVGRIRQIGVGMSTDGIDVVGSRHVRIQGCTLRNGDDCIAIKSLDLSEHDSTIDVDFTKNVEDVVVSDCAFFNDLGGSAMEIGHELRCDTIRDIHFRNIDVMAVHRFGAVFGIHNADHATVQDVSWSDIRVDHHYDRLISFRVVKSRWSADTERGHIRTVSLRNIDINELIYNAGYTHSLIGGFDATHTVDGVSIESLRLNGKAIEGPDEIELYTKHATNVVIRP